VKRVIALALAIAALLGAICFGLHCSLEEEASARAVNFSAATSAPSCCTSLFGDCSCIFDSEFNAAGDSGIATADPQWISVPQGGFAGETAGSPPGCYVASQAVVSGGLLHLWAAVPASQTSCTLWNAYAGGAGGPPLAAGQSIDAGVVSGMVQWASFQFGCGTYEVRMKDSVAHTGGLHTASWLYPGSCQFPDIQTATADGWYLVTSTIDAIASGGGGVVAITTAAPTGGTWTTGDSVTVTGVTGTGASSVNGTWVITVINSTNVSLNGSTFTGSPTGGTIIDTAAINTVRAGPCDWPRSPEIDMNESVNGNNTTAVLAIVTGGVPGQAGSAGGLGNAFTSYAPSPDLSNFHIWSVIRQCTASGQTIANGTYWYMDGVNLSGTVNSGGTYHGAEFNIIGNLFHQGGSVNLTTLPQDLQVDYVHVTFNPTLGR
jgi:hypothetical protein